MKPLPRLLALAALAATFSAQAVTLVPDTWVALPGTTEAAEPQLAGTVLEDDVQAFSFSDGSGTISGTVQSRVVRSSVDGTLDFYWRIISNDRSSAGIGSFRIGQFFTPTSTYNANWRIDGLGNVAPNAAYQFGPPHVGDVNFDFTSPNGSATLGPGQQSYFILLDTTATSYARTGVYDLTNYGQTHISTQYSTFAPAVPEPASYGMLLAGLAVAGVAVKRRRS
jgi:hypothetical protein